MNKSDLTNLSQKEKIVEKLKIEGYSPTYFTNLRDSADKSYRDVKFLNDSKNIKILFIFFVEGFAKHHFTN